MARRCSWPAAWTASAERPPSSSAQGHPSWRKLSRIHRPNIAPVSPVSSRASRRSRHHHRRSAYTLGAPAAEDCGSVSRPPELWENLRCEDRVD
ncbi:hypothetical protein ZWY2020_029984 [Hordeum vulgare]|nr:hypothetical protein ZWY2020_029984 [Hordeum vulgare]